MSSTSSHRLRRGVGVGTMAVAMLALMLPAGAAAAGRVGPTAAELAGLEPVTSGPRRCVVRHDGVSYSTLQAGVDAAEPGETVTLQGICAGFTLIDKDVTIRGVRRERSGNPTITGQGIVPVLWVGGGIAPSRLRPAGDASPGYGAVVTAVGLHIVRGFGAYNGSITLEEGAGLILRNSVVAGHEGTENGAIEGVAHNLLVLRGASEIRHNYAIRGDGGAVDFYNRGRIEMHDTSSMHHNRAWDDGGAIVGANGLVIEMFDDSALHHNRAMNDDDGGAISFYSGGNDRPSLTMNDRARIHGNIATNDGGGVSGREVDVTLNDASRIEDNTADDGAGLYFSDFSTLTLNDNARIAGNAASDSGGGIDAYNSTIILNDSSRVSGNGALAGRGGGIDIFAGSVTMSGNARIAGNRSSEDGGGITAGDVNVSVSGTARITGNRAVTGSGGGMYVDNTTVVTLAGTSVVDLNRAGDVGGGIWVDTTSTLIFDDTAVVRQNIAANDGGGVYAEACATISNLVADTNVLSNTPNDFVQPVC